MKKLFAGAALAVSMLAAAPAANAAQYLNLNPPATDGTISGAFGYDNIGVSNDFTHTFTFQFPSAGTSSGTISTALTVKGTNINFTSVTFNGTTFDLSPNGPAEFGSLINLPVLAGWQTLVVKGTSDGNGSYGGSLSFAPVPEPATWAMMIIGFTGAGVAIRRNRRQGALATA
jgi:opacity protein-like surface antigen